MDKRDEDIARELDAVVGERFAPKTSWRARLAKWGLAALLAILAAATVFYVLHAHIMQAQTAPAPKKPVTIRIVPAQE